MRFQPSRDDGRSDRQVVFDLMENAPPETTLTFAEIGEALAVGLSAPVSRERIYRAVRQGGRTLLARQQRCLQVVRGTGYRVARADEHLMVAQGFETSAQRKIRRGLDVLRGTRVDELTPAQRQLHEGHLLITSGLYQAVVAVHQRQNRQEEVIQGILRRLGQGETLQAQP